MRRMIVVFSTTALMTAGFAIAILMTGPRDSPVRVAAPATTVDLSAERDAITDALIGLVDPTRSNDERVALVERGSEVQPLLEYLEWLRATLGIAPESSAVAVEEIDGDTAWVSVTVDLPEGFPMPSVLATDIKVIRGNDGRWRAAFTSVCGVARLAPTAESITQWLGPSVTGVEPPWLGTVVTGPEPPVQEPGDTLRDICYSESQVRVLDGAVPASAMRGDPDLGRVVDLEPFGTTAWGSDLTLGAEVRIPDDGAGSAWMVEYPPEGAGTAVCEVVEIDRSSGDTVARVPITLEFEDAHGEPCLTSMTSASGSAWTLGGPQGGSSAEPSGERYTLVQIDPETSEAVVRQELTLYGCGYVDLVGSGDDLWVIQRDCEAGQPTGSRLARLDPETGELGREIVVEPPVEYSVGAGDAVWSTRGNQVLRFGEVIAEAPVAANSEGYRELVLSGSTLYAIFEGGIVIAIDTDTHEQHRVPLPAGFEATGASSSLGDGTLALGLSRPRAAGETRSSVFSIEGTESALLLGPGQQVRTLIAHGAFIEYDAPVPGALIVNNLWDTGTITDAGGARGLYRVVLPDGA